MVFVFYHHASLVVGIYTVDLFKSFNPFAELFVGLSGFMVGMIYLRRDNLTPLRARGIKILLTYFFLAIPISIATSLVGSVQTSPMRSVYLVLTFQEDQTYVGILKFYGVIFCCLPLLLPMYRKWPKIFLGLSVSTFLFATHLYHSILFLSGSFFLTQVVLVTLQWQLLFFIGVCLGDAFKAGGLVRWSVFRTSAILFAFGLLIDWLTGFPGGPKFPYSFGKYINLLWTVPVVLIGLYAMYVALEGSRALDLVANVGRHSLVAFIASEYSVEVIRAVCYFASIRITNLFQQQAIGLLTAVFIIWALWRFKEVIGKVPESGYGHHNKAGVT